MGNRLLISFILALLCTGSMLAQATLEGRVLDDLGEGAAFATVALYQGSDLVRGVETDLDGNYVISNLDPGTYDVEARMVGVSPQRQTGVTVYADKIIRLDFELRQGIDLNEVVVIEYKVPLIQTDETSSGGIKTAEDIQNLPIKAIGAIAATTAGVTRRDDDINIRGARAEGTQIFLDGVRVSGNLIPQTEIEQLELITGGLSAKYGDVTGGVISLTSKGPSKKFSGGLEVESSELTDPYGYNLYNANVSGPIIKNSDGQSILGFRLSGQYRRLEDDDPSAVGVYRAREDAIRALEANPDTTIGIGLAPRVEYLDPSFVERLEARPNERNERVDFTGKLDLRVSEGIDLTIGGTYNTENDRFSPGSARYGGSGIWSLLNHVNNPQEESQRYRANLRFRHRIGASQVDLTEDEKDSGDIPVLDNVTYTLQAGYEKFYRDRFDIRHGDNYFNYGYIADFGVDYTPNVVETQDSALIPYATPTVINGQSAFIIQDGYRSSVSSYTPGTLNPGLTNQNGTIGELGGSVQDFNWFNGRTSSIRTAVYAGIYNNVGTVYDRNEKTEFDRYSGNVTLNMNLFPTKSKSNRHALEFGFNYEQRVNRYWRIDPQALWTTARQQANIHLNFIDTAGAVIDSIDVQLAGMPLPARVPVYLPGILPEVQNSNATFWRKIRALTGRGEQEYVNVDALDPSSLTLDLFSASELNDAQLTQYYGYDHTGKKIGTEIGFNDFFSSRDADGKRTFLVAPLTPIYWGAYVQDKFSLKDVIFKVGVRAERFDANTRVLRDPFSLYPIQNADSFFDNNPDATEPASYDPQAKVYVSEEGSANVVGFRVGSQWYDNTFNEVNDPREIFRGNIVRAALVNSVENIRSEDFNVDGSFTDYEPELNIMPRIAVSFPISDEANFFAHYDILVQRPGFQQTNATAFEYYYFSNFSGFIENPNLRPQKTIDYEVGFKQKVSNTSAITLAAYYRELRDMIQLRTYSFLPLSSFNDVGSYLSYDNIDFGTTYGLTFQYDMRRTGNFQMQLNYTLGFADGTGSDVNSSFGIGSGQDLIRTLSPLSYDERHAINIIADYRYGSGNAYNGPRIGEFELFGNMGLNLQANIISGRPYTRALVPTALPDRSGNGFVGSINGARLPWTTNLDLRVDRQIRLAKLGESPLGLNVYVRVTNLLDANNVIDVYNASGSATDDGYLSSQEGVRTLGSLSENDLRIFQQGYEWGLLSPGFYAGPRRIFLGAILQF